MMLSFVADVNEPVRMKAMMRRLSPSSSFVEKENVLLNMVDCRKTTTEAVDCDRLRKLLQFDNNNRSEDATGQFQATNTIIPLSMEGQQCQPLKKSCLAKPPPQQSAATANNDSSLYKKRRRSVTFPFETTLQIHLIDSNNDDDSTAEVVVDPSDLYYTRQDVQEMKRSAKRLCCEASDTSALTEAYNESQVFVVGHNNKDEAIIESVRTDF